MTNETFTPERIEALQTMIRMNLLTLDQVLDMTLADAIDVPLVRSAIMRSDDPAYFDQRFEFKFDETLAQTAQRWHDHVVEKYA
jgi:hypothetical protein